LNDTADHLVAFDAAATVIEASEASTRSRHTVAP